ncbi:terminase small subunit [Skermanella pratensis]|uniref:terminase small subunit n=1 Tax=Skermanella pratensis TaxID=2233999 RepID=UPI00130177A8|nr:terminase small subunit [Skermanella pratensis]
MTTSAASSPAIHISYGQELFCQSMAAGAGAAQAVRRAGYSPMGAGQRGHFLMGRPEIRSRIDQIRAPPRPRSQPA